MGRQTTIGWQNISPTRHSVPFLSTVLRQIQEDYPNAYETPVGEGFAYSVPAETDPKVIAVAWPDKISSRWSYVCMSPIAVEIGLSVSIFLLDDGRIRIYPGNLPAPPIVPTVKRPATSSEESRINGWRLRKARLRHRITQADLAKRIKQRTNSKSHYKLNTIEQLISRFERGEHIPYSDVFLKSVQEILGDLGSEMPPNITVLHRRLPLSSSL